MNNKYAICFFNILILLSCNYNQVRKRDVFVSKDDKIALIDSSSNLRLITASTTFFIPSSSQLELTDSLINIAMIDTANVSYECIIKDYKKYYRQYACYIDNNGDSIIFVNALCQIRDSNWKKELIFVLDGGSCFWQIKINLSQKKYFDFIINGEA